MSDEVCGLCVKTLQKAVKSSAKQLHDVLENEESRNDKYRLVVVISDFTDALERLLEWAGLEKSRGKFLFYGFGPIYYYDSWLADRYECMHTHLDTEFFWTRWKYFLGKIAES
ncbi:MAG: hypothetical protein HY226_06840, partial [Candidatus Vogelbacteria bacterium]|nr:hypothetical protein [Candidatus Vogelbacteria bacterium]